MCSFYFSCLLFSKDLYTKGSFDDVQSRRCSGLDAGWTDEVISSLLKSNLLCLSSALIPPGDFVIW